MNAPLTIVGASYAGLQIAASARELGYDGPIVMLGDEAHAPYQRPPLSKGLLSGKTAPGQLPLRAPSFYDEQRIELRLGCRVESLDIGQRSLGLADGSALRYGVLAITTGARARPLALPGADLAGVHALRTLDDALALIAATERAQRVAVIGGGFIGLEVAAALAERGIAVSVIEAQPRLLARSVPPLLSAYIAELHRTRGVELLCGRQVRELRGWQGRVCGVGLDDGTAIECDLVVAGIGVLPNTEWALQAGLPADAAGRIMVDTLGRTAASDVFAAGDCAAMPSPHAPQPDQPVCLESIQAANDGARAIASCLVGRPLPCGAVPWFWSDQHGVRLQMAGLPAADDEVVLRGRTADKGFSLFMLRAGRIAAVHSVNRPAEHLLARKLVAARAQVDAHSVADLSFDLARTLDP
ncbi:NAD(P)/FAD-dependent oxidoreductase [Methyloversatilis thermotolerans]|uniref:NAD(P)/FAD-dependent oxidoreductase n=1 Tax=Methyloversatilis thermotolerans TaxID=1346290 RepID=UPI00036485C6|nr:FAD-dependent oxidoreductase [Methyloversatilis thermotolerans]